MAASSRLRGSLPAGDDGAMAVLYPMRASVLLYIARCENTALFGYDMVLVCGIWFLGDPNRVADADGPTVWN